MLSDLHHNDDLPDARQMRETAKQFASAFAPPAPATGVKPDTAFAEIRTDPSYLPELRAHADQLRREREAMLTTGAADWVIAGVDRQLEVITEHVRTHQNLLDSLPEPERTLIQDASATIRKARQSVPVAFGRRLPDDHG
jgi:hypothetical protein